MSRRFFARIVLGCGGAILVIAAIALLVDKIGSSSSPTDRAQAASPGPVSWLSNEDRVQRQEALPCTGPHDPINFEIFSAGPSVAGIPLNTFNRRCGGITPADEAPANFTNYIYGGCKAAGGDTGCEPPLEVQTWPACQRTLSDYIYEGQPMPYKKLPSIGDAKVVEVLFEFGPRIEVYTGASTIVLFAENTALARRALEQLRPQESGRPPATKADELATPSRDDLAPPSDGATEGELSC